MRSAEQADDREERLAGTHPLFLDPVVRLFSSFLFLISGYGYRLRYCLGWYLFIVGDYAGAYLLMKPHSFTWWTVLAESVNVFHGRGASPSLSSLTHPARFAALSTAEA